MEKTIWGKTVLTFLGFLIDTENQLVCVPADKVIRALELIRYFLSKKKVTVHEVQKLTGFLNFLCRCITPGCAFTRRLYALMSGGNKSLKPHHHVNIRKENRLDLELWETFLRYPSIFSRKMSDYGRQQIEQVLIYSDASGNFKLGYGAWCYQPVTGFQGWLQDAWNLDFMRKNKPSIEFLELFGVTAAVLTWIEKFANRKIYLFCDNESVCNMINNSSSSCGHCMVLIRIIVLKCLVHNTRIYGKHLRTECNGIADALSRFQTNRFKKLAPELAEIKKTETPQAIWPLHKVWFF